jgi:hypothetical protein
MRDFLDLAGRRAARKASAQPWSDGCARRTSEC